MSDLVVARNCCIARMRPGEAELERTGLPGRAKSVQRFERCNGLDTALYKNDLFYAAKLQTIGCTCDFLKKINHVYQLGNRNIMA